MGRLPDRFANLPILHAHGALTIDAEAGFVEIGLFCVPVVTDAGGLPNGIEHDQ